MFRLLAKIFKIRREREVIQGPFSNTYVIGTSINDPRSLILNWDLISTKYGVFITNSEHYNLIVGYIDLTKVPAQDKQSVAREFLMGLRAEVYEKGSISMRTINTVIEYQEV